MVPLYHPLTQVLFLGVSGWRSLRVEYKYTRIFFKLSVNHLASFVPLPANKQNPTTTHKNAHTKHHRIANYVD